MCSASGAVVLSVAVDGRRRKRKSPLFASCSSSSSSSRPLPLVWSSSRVPGLPISPLTPLTPSHPSYPPRFSSQLHSTEAQHGQLSHDDPSLPRLCPSRSLPYSWYFSLSSRTLRRPTVLPRLESTNYEPRSAHTRCSLHSQRLDQHQALPRRCSTSLPPLLISLSSQVDELKGVSKEWEELPPCPPLHSRNPASTLFTPSSFNYGTGTCDLDRTRSRTRNE